MAVHRQIRINCRRESFCLKPFSLLLKHLTAPMTVHKVVPLPDNADLKRQGLEVPGTKRPGQTGTVKSA
jgi:hypothetical protein